MQIFIKPFIYIAFSLLLYGNSCKGQPKDGNATPVIDYIITNDYISTRLLYFTHGPVPSRLTYKHPLVDSLRHCYVTYYDANQNKYLEKYYNEIGALYETNRLDYDAKNRITQITSINEFKNDTCIFFNKYFDSLGLVYNEHITSTCDSTIINYYYAYNNKGEKILEQKVKNDIKVRRDAIQHVSKYETIIESYDAENRKSTYQYKYNDKGLLVFEKEKEWHKVRGIAEQDELTVEYLYKYDQFGNWTERIKQTHCPPATKNKSIQKNTVKNAPPIKMVGQCTPEIIEKLVRKIHYK